MAIQGYFKLHQQTTPAPYVCKLCTQTAFMLLPLSWHKEVRSPNYEATVRSRAMPRFFVQILLPSAEHFNEVLGIGLYMDNDIAPTNNLDYEVLGTVDRCI
ncbi:hypothetical protein WA026_011318 [Henosepilachna vigintioctopunctata]|uniref:Uncharacterized protein n=1 Tax=Henosepilachna vigintioctopunctata TaxID=420089 RepID=A0AAW1U7I4_9CUCU